MRVAWVTPYAPDHDGGGGHVRQAHLLTGAATDHEVVLVCPEPVRDGAVRAALHDVASVHPQGATWLDRGPLRRRLGDLGGAVAGTWAREERALRPVRDACGQALAGLAPDIVVVEFAGLAPLASRVDLAPMRGAAPWVLTLHNLPSRMARHQEAIAPARRQRWLWGREAAIAAAAERRWALAYDRTVTTSEADRRALPPSAPVTVIGNGVDLERFTPTPLPDEPRLVLTGALYTTPNTDGAVWLCRDVLPLVRHRHPRATVELVGARPPPAVEALAALPGVALHADVADVRPHLEKARVAVVPLRIGSGTRLKAMEAWAAGRPVAGTTIGLEGLHAEPGRHALVADSTEGLAAALCTLLDRGDPTATQLAGAGRHLVESRHGWSEPVARLRALLDDVAHRDRR